MKKTIHGSRFLFRLIAAVPCGVLLWMTAVPLAGASQNDPSRRPFTADEKSQLRAGELVTRPSREKRGSLDLIGGTAWQVIDRPVDAVWQGLLDTSHYQRWLPQVSRALEAPSGSEDASQHLIRIEHSTGPFDVHYYLRAKATQSRGDLTFRLAPTKGAALKAAWGYFNVRPYGAERTLFSFGVKVDIGDGLLVGVLRGTAQEWMLKVPWMMKRFMENSGRWLY